jgi:hypothetical protein
MVRQFLQHVIPGILKPARVLWNEIIGFFFIVLGVWFLWGVFRAWQENGGAVRAGLTGCFALLMLYFGVTSFLRARKISRS